MLDFKFFLSLVGISSFYFLDMHAVPSPWGGALMDLALPKLPQIET